MEKKQIVILGAGFAGLTAALRLGRALRKNRLSKKYKVLLIDKHSYHTYTPLLYEIATTPEKVAGYKKLASLVSFDVEPLVKRVGVDFLKSEVNRLDLINGNIFTVDGNNIGYDALIVAFGSEINYYSIEGLAENAIGFKTVMDALSIREKISSVAADFKEKDFKVVVAGAGSTGVELASELKLWFCSKMSVLGPSCSGTVTLVDSGPRPLSKLLPKLVAAVSRRLEKIDLRVAMNQRIKKVDNHFLYFEDDTKLEYDVLVWSGGVRPNKIVSASGAKKNESGMVCVDEYLCFMPEGAEKVFKRPTYGIGDVVVASNEAGRPAPWVAPEAVGQAKTAVNNILDDILHEAGRLSPSVSLKRKHFVRDWPYIIPVGGKWAVARINNFVLKGFWAWIFKGVVEYRYLVSILGFFRGTRFWLRGLIVFLKNDRLG